jgi:hypothetical protein
LRWSGIEGPIVCRGDRMGGVRFALGGGAAGSNGGPAAMGRLGLGGGTGRAAAEVD